MGITFGFSIMINDKDIEKHQHHHDCGYNNADIDRIIESGELDTLVNMVDNINSDENSTLTNALKKSVINKLIRRGSGRGRTMRSRMNNRIKRNIEEI